MGLRAGGGGAGGPTLGRGRGRWFLPLVGMCVMHAARRSPRQVWSLTAARGVQAPGWVCKGMSGHAGAGVQVSVHRGLSPVVGNVFIRTWLSGCSVLLVVAPSP